MNGESIRVFQLLVRLKKVITDLGSEREIDPYALTLEIFKDDSRMVVD